MSSLLLKGGRIIDPAGGTDTTGDVLIVDGKIAGIERYVVPPPGVRVMTLSPDMIVSPGFVDLHVHLREPGFDEKETISTGTRAAARGGFTTICCMPNTRPPLDTAASIDSVRNKAAQVSPVHVLPIGAITAGQKGSKLADLEGMARAGAVAFSDDGASVHDPLLMHKAMETARGLDLPIFDHCEDKALSGNGCVNAGKAAERLGLPGMPGEAESSMVARDIELARLTGARLHIAHISTAASLELVRQAKAAGLRVSAELTPHHLALTEHCVDGRDTNFKMNPPLRTEEDRQALLQGIREGVIDAVATDHAPHTSAEKAAPFATAPFGVTGLETALGVLCSLVKAGEMDLAMLVRLLTEGPGRVLAAPAGTGRLAAGLGADITVFAPERVWMVNASEFASKGKNNPWSGRTLTGKVVATIVHGEAVYLDSPAQVEIGDRQED